MHRPVQQRNTHPGGETRPQVKEIRCQKMLALPQRGRASLLNQAPHQAGHLQDRDPGRAGMPHWTRKAFSVRPSGFFTDPTPLPGPIGTWMKIFRQEAQGGDFSFKDDHISAHILFSEIHIIATVTIIHVNRRTSCQILARHARFSIANRSSSCPQRLLFLLQVLFTYLPDAILADSTMVRRPP